MSNSRKAALAIFLVLIGALAGRGAVVLASGQYVTTPKYGPGPVLWTGAPAYCMGLFYLLLAVGLGAALGLEIGTPHRRFALATTIVALLAALGVAAYGYALR